MEHDLLTPEDYDGLPDEPELQFLEIERLARRKMYDVIRGEGGDKFEHDFRVQYMVTVAEAAKEIGIDGITFPNGNDFSDDFGWFQQQVHGTITRLRLRNAKRNSAYSVKLANRTRGRIELEITKLRDLVALSDFPESKKAALNERLDELYSEIHNTRLSFAKLMKILGFIGAGFAGAVGTLAAAPTALATITSLVGQDKEAEEAETARIGAPPKALPAPVSKQSSRPQPAAFDIDLDDDVPF